MDKPPALAETFTGMRYRTLLHGALQAIGDKRVVFIKNEDQVVAVMGPGEFTPVWERLFGLRESVELKDLVSE